MEDKVISLFAGWFDFCFVISIHILRKKKRRNVHLGQHCNGWVYKEQFSISASDVCLLLGGHSGIPPQFCHTAAGQQPQVTPPTEWLWALCGRLCLSGHGSLHYKSKWLINGPWTGDTGSTRSVYHPHHRKAPTPRAAAAASSRSALASILSSPLLTHPLIFYSCGAGVLFKKQARA